MREKIELRLDSRQVVGLVLGAAVVLGVVFYLGVGVGRHLGAAPPAEKPDPLAHLDEKANVDAALTFPETLTDTGRAALSPAAPPVTAPTVPAAAVPPSPADDVPAAGRADAAAAAPPAPAPEPVVPAAPAAVAKPVPEARPAAEAKPAPAPKALPSAAEALASHDAREANKAGGEAFTVQAASMPSRGEADAFASKLRAKGLSPQVVSADIPGKGTFYRVRIGRFQSREAADRYLKDFKRETGQSGYVTTTGK
jgi:septal ring-binding cell division protein DamX